MPFANVRCSWLEQTFGLLPGCASSGLKRRAGRVQTEVAFAVHDPNQGQDVGAALMRWASFPPVHADPREDGGVARVMVDGLEIGPLLVHAVFVCVSLAE